MAYCKFCDKEVEPVLKKNRYYCPDCNKYVKATEEEKTEPIVEEIPQEEKPEEREPKHYKKKEPEVVQEGPKKLIMNPKTIKYDASDLHMGEILINLGYAKDLNALTRQNMKLAFSLMNMGAVGKQFNAMETNQEPNPERTMKEIQQQEMMKAYIEGMRKGNQIDPLSMMMLMRMMDNKEQGKSSNNVMDKGKSSTDNNFMNKMLEIQMMKSVMGGQNSETLGLQREFAELKHQMATQQMLNQQQQMQQTGQSSQQFMQEMEKIRSERDRSIKQAEVDAQKERDKNLQLAFDNRRAELESRLQAMEKEKKQSGGTLPSSRIKEMKEEIAAIKEISALIGDREKGTGEMFMQGIGNVAEKVAPAFTELLKQKRQQTPYPTQETLPLQPSQVPQEVPPQALETPNPNLDEPLPPSDMTVTEKQMSDQMSDMYRY